jgi:RNA polymerase sigma factor (sigma-70 family)
MDRGLNFMFNKEFNECYEEHAERIYKYCEICVGSVMDAEEVFQETWTDFYKKLRKGEYYIRSCIALLITIARNKSLTLKRDKKYHDNIVDREDEIAFSSNTEEEYDKKTTQEIMATNIETLPNPLENIVKLRIFNQLSYKEIAEELGITIASAKQKMYRARVILREKLIPLKDDLTY